MRSRRCAAGGGPPEKSCGDFPPPLTLRSAWVPEEAQGFHRGCPRAGAEVTFVDKILDRVIEFFVDWKNRREDARYEKMAPGPLGKLFEEDFDRVFHEGMKRLNELEIRFLPKDEKFERIRNKISIH
jgi:hypothetical protein